MRIKYLPDYRAAILKKRSFLSKENAINTSKILFCFTNLKKINQIQPVCMISNVKEL